MSGKKGMCEPLGGGGGVKLQKLQIKNQNKGM